LHGGEVTLQISCHILPNVGHIHIVLDGTTISILAGTNFILNDVLNKTTGQKVGALSKGTHTLLVRFVDSDHIDFDPPVIAQITFVAV
jgi:hypothetical protein